jgi:hypothetical protein
MAGRAQQPDRRGPFALGISDMNPVLVTAGVVCLMAAVIGGGLKAFNTEFPVLTSRGVRLTLGLLGLAFLVAAVVFRETDANDIRSEDGYQRQVVATCKSVRTIVARNDLGTPHVGPGGITFDRDAFVSTARANLAAIQRRLALLLGKPVPDSLRNEAEVARDRVSDFVKQNQDIFDQLRRRLPQMFTVEQFDAAARPWQDTADSVLARLEDAMTQLAGRDCSLSST